MIAGLRLNRGGASKTEGLVGVAIRALFAGLIRVRWLWNRSCEGRVEIADLDGVILKCGLRIASFAGAPAGGDSAAGRRAG